MKLKRGDILVPNDDFYLSISEISGMLIIVLAINCDDSNMRCPATNDIEKGEVPIYFYQLNKHRYNWQYIRWLDKCYKVLQ